MGFKDNPIVFLTAKTWEYAKGNRKQFLLLVGLFLLANAISLLEPLVVAKILNTIQEQGITQESLSTLLVSLFLFLAITIGFWIFHGPARVLEEKIAFLIKAQYKKYLIDGTMNLPLKWHSDHHSGDTIDKIEKGTNALYDYASEFSQVIETLVLFIGSYIALILFNVHASYLVLFLVLVTGTVILKFDKHLVRQYRILFRTENKISAKVFDTLSNITTVIILRVEDLLSKAIFMKVMRPYKLFVKNNKLNEWKWFTVSVFTSLMVISVLFSFIYFNSKTGQTILIGTVYALYGYVDRINDLFFRFAFRYGHMVRRKARVKNAEEVAREFKPKDGLDRKKLHSWKLLEVKNLDFSYHTKKGAQLHLQNINLSIAHGENIAFVGSSGSGKTTMLKVMRDLYHPKKAHVSLDGQVLPEGFRSISHEITLIPQDPEIFSTTIKENITLGVDYGLDHLKTYTDLACFTDVVERLPKKFNSHINEKGVNLSGGERQRLALARGLLACDDKTIVLLDEPTSSVDSKNELQIYQNIFNAFKGKTIISSIHRLHLLPLFDTIFFFKNGKIVARGNFNMLLKTSKEFNELWKKYHKSQKTKKSL